jgi:beta-galactosidase
VPYVKIEPKEGTEYTLLLSFRQKGKSSWADPGFEIAWDQFQLPWFKQLNKATELSSSRLTAYEEKDKLTISGKDFSYIFNKRTGTIVSMKINGKELIKRGAELNVWRAPLANETDEWAYWSANNKHKTDGYGRFPATEWYSAGLDKIQLINDLFRVIRNDDQTVIVEVKNVMQLRTKRGSFMNHYIYSIRNDGELTIEHSVIPDGDMPSWLPRVGVDWILDKSLGNVQWYGRGPQENYPDRKSGYRIGLFKSTVEEMYEPYLIPQDYGLRCDNRWVRMTDEKGCGLEFSGDKLFNFSAQMYSQENLTKALYTYQLQPFDGITLNLDYATSGVGCTALSVFQAYQVMAQRYDFRLTVKPIYSPGPKF